MIFIEAVVLSIKQYAVILIAFVFHLIKMLYRLNLQVDENESTDLCALNRNNQQYMSCYSEFG